MVKQTVTFLVLYALVMAGAIVWASTARTKLFADIPWIFSIAMGSGIILGVFAFRAKRKNARQSTEPPRHTLFSFMEHWGAGMGILLMIVSSRLLGLSFVTHGANSPVTPSNLHFTGLVFTLFFGASFLTDFLISRDYRTMLPNFTDIWDGTIKKYLLRKPWHDTGKYLSSQKSALLAFAVLGLGVLVTGVLKSVGLRENPLASPVSGLSYAHDILALLFILLVIVHILLVTLFPTYRRLLPGWFTGRNGAGH